MKNGRSLAFSGSGAGLQYRLLMGFYRLALSRYWFYPICKSLARLFPKGNAVLLKLGKGSHFKIRLDDPYWTRFALFHRDYEPEVRRVIDAAAGHTGLFCDLGANKGYWSVYAAPLFDRIIAVEASGHTFRALQENAAQAANIETRQAAVFHTTDQTLTLLNTYQSHASARLGDAGSASENDRAEQVRTVAIDDLVPPGTAALIKLDVEGAEVAAITSASRALEDGCVLIYEDHGADLDCRPSAYLIGLGNISIYSIETAPQRILDLPEIRALKTDPYKGYNFVAARSGSPLLGTVLGGLTGAETH